MNLKIVTEAFIIPTILFEVSEAELIIAKKKYPSVELQTVLRVPDILIVMNVTENMSR